MADNDFILRLDDTLEEQEDGGEAQVPVAMDVGPGEAVDPHEGQARFHNVLEVRNFTKYELEGSPTLWFDEFQKCYVLTKDATDARPTVYLKCHRYTAKRGIVKLTLIMFLLSNHVKIFRILKIFFSIFYSL